MSEYKMQRMCTIALPKDNGLNCFIRYFDSGDIKKISMAQVQVKVLGFVLQEASFHIEDQDLFTAIHVFDRSEVDRVAAGFELKKR